MLANPQGCHMCFIIPNNLSHPRAPKFHDKLKLQTHLGSAISKQQVYGANHAGMSYLFYRIELRIISTGLRFYFFL